MGAPTKVYVNFFFTIPSGFSEYWYILTIDGKFVAKVNGNEIQSFNTVLLSVGVHRYEIKCVNPARFTSRSGPSSIAASGPFLVDVEHTKFIVGATTPSALDHAIQYILNVINLVENTAAYSLFLESSESYDAWVIATFCDQQASSESDNYSNGVYRNFSSNNGQWDDIYPLGSNIHIEGTAIKNGIQVGTKQVIDLIAGQPPAPTPSVVQFQTGFPVLNSIVYNSTGTGIGTPPSPSVPCVSIYTGGDYSSSYSNVNFSFAGGQTLISTPANNSGAPFNFTSGSVFDYVSGLNNNQSYPYFSLDEQQNIIGIGAVQFTAQ